MIEFTLPDMTCGHCSKAVTSAVQAIDPDAHIQIDLSAQRVHIQSQKDAQAFAAALTQEGYPPRAPG